MKSKLKIRVIELKYFNKLIELTNKKIKRRIRSKVKYHLSDFQREFRKHLTTFITGAFAFVAALIWRDAISKSIESLKELIPQVRGWVFDYLIAIFITLIAVIAIIAISKLLKVEK